MNDAKPEVRTPCDRCGNFTDPADLREVFGKQVCEPCREHQGVDYLQDMVSQYWGRRDNYVWIFGIGGIITSLAFAVYGLTCTITVALGTYTAAEVVGIKTLVTGLAGAALFACYVLMKPWTRVVLPLFFLVSGLLTVLCYSIVEGRVSDQAIVWAMLNGVCLLLAIAAYRDAQNRLAFQIEITGKQMQRLWSTRHDNPMARTGATLALLSFCVPFLSFVAIICCIIGLTRIDSKAWPPVGGWSNCIAGLIIALLALLRDATIILSFLGVKI